jgi:hypothetical protein
MRLLATMPLHAIASVQGQAGLRERLLLEIAGFPPHARAGRDHERGDVRGRQPLTARAVRRQSGLSEWPDEGRAALGGRHADAALGHQVTLEPLQQFLRLRRHRRLRPSPHPDYADLPANYTAATSSSRRQVGMTRRSA